jgi:hypothetical protein
VKTILESYRHRLQKTRKEIGEIRDDAHLKKVSHSSSAESGSTDDHRGQHGTGDKE